MKYLIAIALTLYSAPCLGMGPDSAGPNPYAPVTDFNPYHEADVWQWSNYNTGLHIVGAYSLTLVTALILEKQFGMKPFPAAVFSALGVGLLGTAKEVMIDNYVSRVDIQSYWVGSIAACLTYTVISF